MPKGKNKTKVIGIIENEFGRKVMMKFVGLKAKTYRMTVVKIKKQEVQKSMWSNENLNLEIIKTV